MTDTKEQMIMLVQQGIDDFLKGNIPALMNRLTEDVLWATYQNPEIPFAQTFRGKEAVGQFFTELDNSVDFNVFSPEKYYSDGDMVFVKVHEMATVKSTGKTYDFAALYTCRIKEGMISEFFAYVDSASQDRAFSKDK